jgi:hypothetical protein
MRIMRLLFDVLTDTGDLARQYSGEEKEGRR